MCYIYCITIQWINPYHLFPPLSVGIKISWFYPLQMDKNPLHQNKKECFRYSTERHLRLHFWSSRECRVSLNCHYSHAHSTLTKINSFISVSVEISFGWVLWHINQCRLFNAKTDFYVYIKYIGFGLVGIYCISTIVGHLMPKPVFTYI